MIKISKAGSAAFRTVFYCCVTLSVLMGRTSFSAAEVMPQKQPKARPASPLMRRYRLGETLSYVMKGVNQGRRYEARANGIVKRDPAGTFYEEFRWSDLAINGKTATLPSANDNFRQLVSLAPDYNMSLPDFGQVPELIGPVLDFLTFYVDLQLAARQGTLIKRGDHAIVKVGGANSWADGRYIVLGEDSLDFDLTLESVSQSDGVAVLSVTHVPPDKPGIKLPADWMTKPVSDTPNNWVEVHKNDRGMYVAAVGKETFDVRIKVSLSDGKILSATMENPVETIERECSDAALQQCGEAKPNHILRQIEMHLEK